MEEKEDVWTINIVEEYRRRVFMRALANGQEGDRSRRTMVYEEIGETRVPK